MGVIQGLQAVLIDALLREATAAQASMALAEVVRVVSDPEFFVSDEDDEEAAAWAAALLVRLPPATSLLA